jgi:glutamate-1-semialdehyde 2,1-aminomutase
MLGTYCTLISPQEVELADTLLGLHPWAGKVRYCRGGGEALTIAVRLARAATGRSGVAFCGYHGWHDWYLAANLAGTTALDGHLLPGLEPRGVPRELRGTSVPFRYNDLESLKAAVDRLGGNLAAVVMEPMRSQWPKDDFVAKAAAICRAAGAVFVVDEVSSGLRFGFPGALSRLGVQPDLVAYAKAMGNGFPFGAIVGTGEVFKAAGASFVSSSFWTDGVGPAAALAVLEKVGRLRVHEVVWERGERLQAGLRQIAGRHPACRLVVGGMPAVPTMTFDLGADAALASTLFARKMCQKGFLVGTNYYVMLAHEEAMIAQLLEAMDPAMDEIEAVIASGRLAEEAGVERGLRGFARLA